MDLPFNMRTSSLLERKKFYKNFNIEQSRNLIQRDVVYAMILGKHSNIYIEKYEEDKKTPLIIDNYNTLEDVKAKIIHYLPESVYYDRNDYKDISLCHSQDLRDVWDWHNFMGQELAFDIDPENVNCPLHGDLQHRMRKGMGLSFCEKAFELAKQNTLNLYDNLNERYNHVKIVFSGRGFHIHILDRKTKTLNKKEREKIADDYQKFGIDKWITTGEMRLIRLPYSLNAISSRIVTPLEKSMVERFDPWSDSVPDFISD